MTQEMLTERRDQLRATIEDVQTRYERARAAARAALLHVNQLRGALALCDELLATEDGAIANGGDSADA